MAIPVWINFYLGATVGMAALFSVLAYVNPGVQFATWGALSQPDATSLAGPVGLYIARNLATAGVGLFALSTAQWHAVTAAIVLRLLTDGLDAAHNLAGGNGAAAAFAATMFAVECAAVVQLRSGVVRSQLGR